MKFCKAALPHVTIMLSIAFAVLWILDYFNPKMQFLTAAVPKAMLLILLICAIASSILCIVQQRHTQ